MDIILNSRLLCDLELILNGSFSPLKGFMKKKDYKNVVKNMRLNNGVLFPLPIVLPINVKQYTEYKKLSKTDKIILKDEYNYPIVELINHEVYKPDLKKECLNVYGTKDTNHPYVKILLEGDKKYYLGGDFKIINQIIHYDFEEYRLKPKECNKFISKNNWNTIVGFQTRNPMHRSHFELTKYALKKTNDKQAKLLLSPIVGITQECDVNYHTRVRCYIKLLNYYKKENIDVKLILIPLSMRMAGPREALMHSIIRKNYGCTHFIVGRDHAGPSYKKKDGTSFYEPYAAHELVKKHENEIGIKMITAQHIVYVDELDSYLPIDEVKDEYHINTISGTQQRNMLEKGMDIPEWFSYPDIVKELRKTYKPKNKKGLCLYFFGLSGAGKTTIANHLISKLRETEERNITLLDGDVIRQNLSKGLTFSKEDRSTNVRRIGYVASEIVKHGGIAVCSNIAPYIEDRNYNRTLISKYGNYVEVYVNTEIDKCEERDVKGLYKLARANVIKNFTGINDPFEISKKSELTMKCNNIKDIDKNIDKIIIYLKENCFI